MSMADIDRAALEGARNRPVIVAKFIGNALNGLFGSGQATGNNQQSEQNTQTAIDQVQGAKASDIADYLNQAKTLGPDPALQDANLGPVMAGAPTAASVPTTTMPSLGVGASGAPASAAPPIGAPPARRSAPVAARSNGADPNGSNAAYLAQLLGLAQPAAGAPPPPPTI